MGEPIRSVGRTFDRRVIQPTFGKAFRAILGGGSSATQPSALPAPPTLGELPKPPAAPPPPPDATSLAVRAARDAELRRGRRLGHRTTILTGPQGAPGQPTIRGPRLLGY